MRTFNYGVFLTIAILIGCSGGTASNPPEPKFDSKDFDFGRIPSESVVSHQYKLSNTGGDSIIVMSVRAHCGCTKAPLVDSIVKAGKTVPIELRFNSGGFRGSARKSASIKIKVGENEIDDQLYFSTFIDTSAVPFSYGELGAEPYKIEFSDSIDKVDVKFINRVAADRTVKIIDYQPDRVELSWKEKKIGPKKEATLTVKRKKNTENIVASVTVEMDGIPNSRITIPISEARNETPRIKATPPLPKENPTTIPWQK